MADAEVDPEVRAEALAVQKIVRSIHPLLTGQPPHIMGAVLGDLVASFIAGHAPDLREAQINLLVTYVRTLVPVEVDAMISSGHWPEAWRGDSPEQREFDREHKLDG